MARSSLSGRVAEPSGHAPLEASCQFQGALGSAPARETSAPHAAHETAVGLGLEQLQHVPVGCVRVSLDHPPTTESGRSSCLGRRAAVRSPAGHVRDASAPVVGDPDTATSAIAEMNCAGVVASARIRR